MPPKRAAAAAVTKAESPSRRKVGRPKKVQSDFELDEEEPEEAEQEEAEPEAETPSPAPRRRGGRKRTKAAAADEEDDGGVTTVVTLNMEDLIDLPPEIAATASPGKKRKAPAKSAATKKSKSDTSLSKDVGGGGDGENLIQCSMCDAKVVQLVRHIRAQHGDDPDYDSKIKEARSLEAKVQSAAPKKPSNNLLDDLTITASKLERTPIVDRRTTGERGNSLVRPKNTQCPICEKVVRRYDLNKHIRNVHSGEKPNKCPYCEYASPWKGNLNTHIAGVHTKARLHDCIRCGLSFKTRSAMIGHVRKVHDKMYQPKERLFECEECNKKFYKKFHLQRHIRVHTGEKPFTCAFCEKMFASKTNMDSHIQSVHLKIKPFKCGYCEKGFARKKMMLIHIRKYHMNKEDASLLGMTSIDDITLDDNMDDDGDSDGSVESGEILGAEDGMADAGMVLVKMRDDEAGAETGVKQYMFMPTNDLPSDLDNTLDTTAGDDSLLVSDRSMSGGIKGKPSPVKTTSETVTKIAANKNQPVVINVGAGQVVQAVQTKDGIMLVTQAASESTVKATTKTATPIKQVAETVVAEPEKVVEKEPSPEPEKFEQEGEAVEKQAEEKTTEPVESEGKRDLVEEALAESVPEGVSGKAAIISTDTDPIGGLPANLLATEEGDQAEATNGEKTVETFFLTDIQQNGA